MEEHQNLKNLLLVESDRIYIPVYVTATQDDKLAAETLGVLVSQMLHWAGEEVGKFLLIALASGLEDANWHTEAGVVFDWIERLEKGAMIGDVLKEVQP